MLFSDIKNRHITPGNFEFYKTQCTGHEGKVGVFMTGLFMPETYDYGFFYNITKIIFSVITPWPIFSAGP